MKTFVLMGIVFLAACSSTPVVNVENVIQLPDGGQEVPTVDGSAPGDVSVTTGQDAGVGVSTDSGQPQQDGSDDGGYRDLDTGIDSPIITDASPTPDAYDGIQCLTTQYGLVIGCDGYTGPSTSGFEVKTANYDCPSDGSGYGTCAKGAVCEVVMPGPTYYPGTCQ